MLLSRPTTIKSQLHSFTNSYYDYKEQEASLQSRSSSSSKNKPLPNWMTEYFEWHAQQKQQLLLYQRHWQSSNHRYLILRCSYEDKKCGGTADRLKSIPLFLRLAYESKRIFLIRWTRQYRLEEFLQPHHHRGHSFDFNWSVPDWLEQILDDKHTKKAFHNRAKSIIEASANYNITIVEGRLQVQDGGAKVYADLIGRTQQHEQKQHRQDGESYESFYHQLFRYMFQPSPPISRLVNERMDQLGLRPGDYSVAHYRAFYGMEEHKDTFDANRLATVAINAVNCASKLLPGHPVYFASDSTLALDTVRSYRYVAATQGHKNNRLAMIATNHKTTSHERDEVLHLDIDNRGNVSSRSPSDFYDTFVDLLIMGGGRCVSYGTGGFGQFAQLLSFDSSCSNRHFDKGRMQECHGAMHKNF